MLQIAAELPLLWASAGYTYSLWRGYDTGDTHDRAVYAHARRYTGYDIPEYVGEATSLSHAIRSVNWLTLLGPALLDKLPAGAAPALLADPTQLTGVTTTQLGNLLCLQAGPRPLKGDRNRLQVPPAYQVVDAFVRPVRAGGKAGQGNQIQLGDPWSEDDTRQWLQRFGPGGVVPPPRPVPAPLVPAGGGDFDDGIDF